jgi:hypothetical protein
LNSKRADESPETREGAVGVRFRAMRDEGLLTALEALAHRLRIPVTYAALATEELPGRGGMCVIRGERRIIIERSLGTREKAGLLAAGLAQFDFEDCFLLPAVREAIEWAKTHRGQDYRT